MVTKSLIQREELYSSKEDEYLEDLKQIVFDEIIKRVTRDMDQNATDILYTARRKLKEIRKILNSQ